MAKQSRDRKEIKKDAPIWAHRINQCLIERNMTQEELSKISGVSKSSLTGWLYGGITKDGKNKPVTEPKVTGITNIAEALGVTTDYLLGRNDTPTHEQEDICERTGLDDKSVKILLRWQEAKKVDSSYEKAVFTKTKVLDFIIQHGSNEPGSYSDANILDSLYAFWFARYYAPKGWSIDEAREIRTKWATEFYEREGRTPTNAEYDAQTFQKFEMDKVTDMIPVIVDDCGTRIIHHIDGKKHLKDMHYAEVTEAIVTLDKIANSDKEADNARKEK